LKVDTPIMAIVRPHPALSSGVWLVVAGEGDAGMNMALELDDDTRPRLVLFVPATEGAMPKPIASLDMLSNARFVWLLFDNSKDKMGILQTHLIDRDAAKFVLGRLKFDPAHVDRVWPTRPSQQT